MDPNQKNEKTERATGLAEQQADKLNLRDGGLSYVFSFVFIYMSVRLSLCSRRHMPTLCTLLCLVQIKKRSLFSLLCVLT